jgi:co-chaperonin GroES (HSP10)
VITHDQLNQAVKELDAYADRIVVIVDEYKSGRECTKCKGKGHLGEACPHCKGSGYFKADEEQGPCPDCTVGEGPLSKTLTFVPCDLCAGRGTSSIVVPDDAQKRPTTGVITSVGPLCAYSAIGGQFVPKPLHVRLKVGDRVFFTLYSGNEYQLGPSGNQITIRILKEAEVLGKIKSQAAVQLQPETFKELTEVGMSSEN